MNLKRWALRLMVGAGVAALVFYLAWGVGRWECCPLFFIAWLLAAIICATPQLLGNWALYLAAQFSAEPVPDSLPETSVDVFVTAYHEPYEMIQRSLAAAVNMNGAHNTWLLDDSNDPALQALANRLGAGYLTRPDRQDAKAGNINFGLAQTQGDILVIFDVDHVPQSLFLEQTLPYFQDPTVGFVQVMLTFENQYDGWVAQAAIGSTLDYYNPTSIGADRLGSATHTGSNALIHRKALESIGGYKPGLAEDLATSIALHAAGWKSAYVHEPLAPGLAPQDMPAWFTQQLKWSRGVFELLLTAYPKYFRKLTVGQKISYAVRMTNYWIGVAIGLHLLFTIVMLWAATPVTISLLNSYVIHLLPLGILVVLIRQRVLVPYKATFFYKFQYWKPFSLIYFTWPIYTLAWLMAVLRLPLRFAPTPKTPGGAINPLWFLPQGVAVLSLISGALYAAWQLGSLPVMVWGLMIIEVLMHLLIYPSIKVDRSEKEIAQADLS